VASPAVRRSIYRVGPPADDIALARRVGPKGHVVWVGGPVPRGADGITVGGFVIVRRSAAAGGFDQLLRHEQVHVAQFREHGVVGFLVGYLRAYFLWRARGYGHWGAYRRIPFEVEARWIAAQPLVDPSWERGAGPTTR
jgi:hypothetical protein